MTSSESASTTLDNDVTLIKSRYGEVEISFGLYRQKLVSAIGLVYELSHNIDSDKNKLELLRKRTQDLVTSKGDGNFEAAKKKAAECLLILMTDYDPKKASSRTQWKKAIKAAHGMSDLARTEEAFVKLVGETKGGMRGLGETKASSSPGTSKHNIFQQDVAWLRRLNEDAPAIEINATDMHFHEGVSVVVFGNIGGGRAKSLGHLSDPDRIEAVTISAYKRLIHAEDREYRERQALWDLNYWPLMFSRAPDFSGEPLKTLADKFASAYKLLFTEEEWCVKYKLGGTQSPHLVGEGNYAGHFRIEVQNPDFHEFDPGRYIKGAQPDVLRPYPTAGDRDDQAAAAREWDRAHQQYVANRKKRYSTKAQQVESSARPFEFRDSESDPNSVDIDVADDRGATEPHDIRPV